MDRQDLTERSFDFSVRETQSQTSNPIESGFKVTGDYVHVCEYALFILVIRRCYIRVFMRENVLFQRYKF